MTVDTSTNKSPLVSDGVQTDFLYDFLVLEEDHMNVYINGVLDDPSNWTITGLGSQSGGTVTRTPAPAAGIVTLLRIVPNTQLTDYSAYGDFPAETHEKALDLRVMEAQQLNEEVGRTLRMPLDYVATFDHTLPAPVAGKSWKVNATNDGIVMTTYDPDEQTTLAVVEREAAEAARAATEAVYDNFDDRYLGAKASDPTLDNDGDALLTGALYFNTTDNTFRVYNGATWDPAATNAEAVAAAASAAAALVSENAAAASETAAAGIYDDFDDRYLGAKASDPTLDNDGDALQTGALYYKTGEGWRIWNGATWDPAATNAEAVAAAASAAAALVSENAAAADLVLTNADVVSTNADAAATALDRIATNADAAATAADKIATNADAAATAADLIATNQDTLDTAADAAATAADLIATNQDTLDTAADAAATAADKIATNADAAATAADVITVAGIYDDFDDRYLGPKASNPTLDNDGDALVTGAMFFNTTTGAMKVYDGASWGDIASLSSVSVDNYADVTDYTSGTTTQLTLTNTPASENSTFVTFDGVSQHKDTYSLSGSVITFSSAIPLGTDNVEVTSFIAVDQGTVADGSITEAKLGADSVTQSKVHPDVILGTVSQSGGVPTGAIIERGSNANGEYVRYADGTQICTRVRYFASLDLDFARGTIFSNTASNTASTIPAAFAGSIEDFSSSAHIGGAAFQLHDNMLGVIQIEHESTGEVRIILGSAVSQTGVTVTLTILAIGRWF